MQELHHTFVVFKCSGSNLIFSRNEYDAINLILLLQLKCKYRLKFWQKNEHKFETYNYTLRCNYRLGKIQLLVPFLFKYPNLLQKSVQYSMQKSLQMSVQKAFQKSVQTSKYSLCRNLCRNPSIVCVEICVESVQKPVQKVQPWPCPEGTKTIDPTLVRTLVGKSKKP